MSSRLPISRAGSGSSIMDYSKKGTFVVTKSRGPRVSEMATPINTFILRHLWSCLPRFLRASRRHRAIYSIFSSSRRNTRRCDSRWESIERFLAFLFFFFLLTVELFFSIYPGFVRKVAYLSYERTRVYVSLSREIL